MSSETTELTFVMASRDLLNALANTVVFASKDATLPILCAVMLEVEDGHLTAYATDRYRLARVRVPMQADAVGDMPQLIMSRKIVDQFVKHLKGDMKLVKYGASAHLTARVDGGQVVSWALSFNGVATEATESLDGQYPKIKQLFPEAQPSEPAGLMAFNPALLADMGKIKDHAPSDRYANNEPLRIVGGGSQGKPTSFFRFTWFEALLMPVRVADGAYGNFGLAA